ncbi:MAG: HAMP domain-containing histidine kinase [Gammaproteobacteria bacterium]|nr:HAMP domain-containing histidine kinase [Gammaproteobacteria bacterium]
MRLHSNIFFWIFIASVLPLTVLAFIATQYVQAQYEEEAYERLHTNLHNMASEIRRHFDNERNILLGLAESRELREYFSSLEAISLGTLPPQYARETRRLTRFLASFSRIQPGMHTIRVLDATGNTLVKVQQGRRVETILENFSGLPYVEQEVVNDSFVSQLQALPEGDVANLLLPQRGSGAEFQRIMPMLDHVVALDYLGERIGFLSVTYEGEFIDRILDYSPRMLDGQLLLAELNPDDGDRNGMLLYRDSESIRLAQVRYGSSYLQSMDGGAVWNQIDSIPEGSLEREEQGQVLHFIEFQPYRNTLVSWVLAIQVDSEALSGPFRQIRIGIWLLIGFALFISLAISRFGSRHIAEPVCQLASNLKEYADGESDVRVTPRGAEEIRQLGRSFNYMADTLDQARGERDRAQKMMMQTAKLASIGEMAAGIGHEINNPLNNILSYAKLIERGLGDGHEPLKRDLSSLREEAMRASGIVQGILNFSRQMPSEFTVFDACDWLRETVTLVQREGDKREVRLMSDCPQGMLLYGDRSLLQQVLVNLMLNAVQASTPGQRVYISLSEDGPDSCIEVVDEGAGISPEDMERVFDPFFSTKEVGEGSGLGLSISLGIIEHHGGSIRLKNLGDGGVKVSIRLPQHQEESKR